MKTPAWWYRQSSIGTLLAPLSALYGAGATLRARLATPATPDIPTLCIGNIVAGGGGKTPVVLAVGAWCKAHGIPAYFVSRGYGGKLTLPTLITPSHTARDAGDEPLLLAKVLPTVVGKNRAEAVAFAASQGATLAILDDGLQNPTLQKTAAILVLKGERPLGNHRLIPAGPLREPLEAALARVQAAVWVDAPPSHTLPISVPLFTARTTLSLPVNITKAIGFAGIARPELFKQSLEAAGVELVDFQTFGDHHTFTTNDIADLRERANHHHAVLVTTEKDWVRLPPETQAEVIALPLTLTLNDAAAFEGWLSAHVPVSCRRAIAG